MKKLLLFSAIIFAAACSSPQKKAENLTKDYLKKNTNDQSKYEPIEFSELDSAFSYYIDSEEGRKLFDERFDCRDRSNDLSYEAEFCKTNEAIIKLDSAMYYLSRATELEELFDKNNKAYKGDMIGWKFEHKFRTANGLGATVLVSAKVRFNKELTEIVELKEIE